ncbi:site-specific integrase [Geminicoccus harenae]|uniref:site-specific integrase n=1 Tax=Geminicoccus harenae TaxID=2498453 RepID=UPI00168B5E7A|nr:site-specific integrase [Geminicoccus harenae]
MTDQPVRCLKRAEWPEADRLAFAKATRANDLLDDPGPFAELKPSTIATIERGYGRWLWWHQTQDTLGLNISPAARITREAVSRYLDDLRARNAPLTVAHRILTLEQVARAIAPEANWRWLRRLVNRLGTRARPMRDKRCRLRPVDDVFRAGLAMMAEAETGRFTSPKKRALAFRDGLLIAILAARAPRAANLATMEIDRHLRRSGKEWMIVFAGSETKNGDVLELPLPAELSPLLERYLTHWRPVLLDGKVSQRLWISAFGQSFETDQLYFVVMRATEKQLGVRINPHLLRSGLATAAAQRDPGHAGLATPMLGHRVGVTTERHYNLARQHEAASQWQQHVLELRREARRRAQR